MDFTNTSGIRSPFSPRVRQSITGLRQGLTPVKKNQSQFMQSKVPAGDVIYKTPLITMETFGHPLPVLVTEALTFASGSVSVQLSPCGYCWLVCGRRLLCWSRGGGGGGGGGGGAARELTLPQTDLQHRAELVQVFHEDGAQMPSCIGVSPEGVVRYWPSIGQESYVDTSCELAGQECAKLCAASSGLLLATTSCSLLILHPEPSRPAVTCQPLRPPSGWLGGLGRRVSLLFFGSMPANADTKLVGVVVLQDGPLGPAAAAEAPGYVALVGGGGGAVLQLWRGPELFEHNLRRALTDAISKQGDASSLRVSCVDVRGGGAAPAQLVLLVAAAGAAQLDDTRYAIGQYVDVRGRRGGGAAPAQLVLLVAAAGAAQLDDTRYAIGQYVDVRGRRGGGAAPAQLVLLVAAAGAAQLDDTRYAIGQYVDVRGRRGGGAAPAQLVLLVAAAGAAQLDDTRYAIGQYVDVRGRRGGGAAPAQLVLLVAAAGAAQLDDTRYAIAQMSVEDPANPRVTSLLPLRGCALSASCAPRLLPLRGTPLLYGPTYVQTVSTSVPDKVEYIDVSAEGDRILGAELCRGVPLLFSRKHGVLALTPHVSVCESPMGSPCPSDVYDGNLSLYEIDPHEVSMVTTDACGKLKTAFLFHLRRDPAAGRALLDELFPHTQRASDALDRTVLAVAAELADDIPQGDPRWKQKPGGPATNIPLGSSSSLQISAQLRDKQRAFSLFVDFLRAAGLWQRLGAITPEGGGEAVSTVSALGSLAEKLAAAVALRSKQQGADAQLVDAAVYQVVCGEDAAPEEPEVEAALSSGALSPSDVCYRRVSGIPRVLCALARAPHAHGDGRAAAAHAAHAASLLTSVLSEVHKCRAQWQQRALGLPGLAPALLGLHHRAVAQYGPNCPDPTLRAQLYEATAVLADMILTDAAAQHTARPRGADTIQRQVIQPYIDAGQTERAAVLAEKFKDFELLVEMCVREDNMEKLYSYIDKYSAEGIAEIAFAYLMDRGGADTARLVGALGARYPARLQAWLERGGGGAGGGGAGRGGGGGRPALALLHLARRRPARAAAVLAGLAAEERDSVHRLATTASLAKLCLLATDETPPPALWNKVESGLSLAEQHAALPRDVKLLHGLDAADCPVLPHEDLVQMYIDCDSDALTEYDYKKALDLTDFVEDMERRDDLRLRVWCACVRRSAWEACDTEAPHEELQRKMFFRLMHLVHAMGGDLALLLPPAEDILTARELAELVSDPRFRYIIKYGYECLHAGAGALHPPGEA